jgi:hypothetical protein
MIDIVEIARTVFEEKHANGLPIDKIRDYGGKWFYVVSETQQAFDTFFAGYAACLGSPLLTRYIDQHNSMVIDLDLAAWESIKRAASESPWMPEDYTANDWIADVCDFLKTPRGE